MRNKDYRELSLTSTQLVFVFLAILILGVVIFLLGVSVGKEHAQLAKTTLFTSEKSIMERPPEQVEGNTSVPVQESKNDISKELAAHEKVQGKAEEKRLTSLPQHLYYVQVGAFYDRTSANSFAAKFKARGHAVVVIEPYSTDKKPVYRIRVGGFSTREEAEKVKANLAQAEGKKKTDYFIVMD